MPKVSWRWLHRWTWWQAATHIGALIPLAIIIWDYWHNQLTVNPIQELTFRTGWYALVLLILSLACTPINTFFGLRQVLALRKPLGLYAFMYVAFHLLIFVGLDYGFYLPWIYEAIFEKPYALVGFTAFMILLPLAITSTQAWQRRLRKNWKRLHRGVYLAALLVIVHFYMLVKADVRRPLAYGTVIVLLLLLRTPWVRRQASKLRSQLWWTKKKRVVVDGV